MPKPDRVLCPEGREEMATMAYKPGRGRPYRRHYWAYYCPKHKVAVIFGVRWS